MGLGFNRLIGRAFNTPLNNEFGQSELFPVAGIVEGVDEKRNVASVRTSNGLLTDVRIPILGYSNPTGIYHKPSKNDYCLVITTAKGDSFILGFYTFDGLSTIESDPPTRPLPAEHSYIIQTKSGDLIQISKDAETGHIYLRSLENIELALETSKKSAIITLNNVDDSNTSLVLKVLDTEKSETTASITINTKTEDIVLSAKDVSIKLDGKNNEITVNDGQSPVVTLDMLQNIITSSAPSFRDGGIALLKEVLQHKTKNYKFKA